MRKTKLINPNSQEKNATLANITNPFESPTRPSVGDQQEFAITKRTAPWSASFKNANESGRSVPVVFTSPGHFEKKPLPLIDDEVIPKMVGNLKVLFADLNSLIETLKNLSKSDNSPKTRNSRRTKASAESPTQVHSPRDSASGLSSSSPSVSLSASSSSTSASPNGIKTQAQINKQRTNIKIAKATINIMRIASIEQIEEHLETNNLKHCMACVNNNSTFKERLDIINKLMRIDSYNEICKSKIEDYEAIKSQLDLEKNLHLFKIKHIPLQSFKESEYQRTRVIFTDSFGSNSGFEKLLKVIKLLPQEDFNEDYSTALKELGATRVLEILIANNIHRDFEIAWGHIMNQGKHLEEDIVYVSCREALQYVLPKCANNSTLVVDAHGGSGKLTIEQKTFGGDDLRDYIQGLVDTIGPNITHVILSSCHAGSLAAPAPTSTRTHTQFKFQPMTQEAANRHNRKNRMKVYVEPHMNSDSILDMFEKLEKGDSCAANSLAASFAAMLLTKKSQDSKCNIAFTFSPSILVPDLQHGVMGVPSVSALEGRRNWPDFVDSWEKDESVKERRLNRQDPRNLMVKSVTMYNSPHNPKALGENRAWKNEHNGRNLFQRMLATFNEEEEFTPRSLNQGPGF